MALIPGLMWDRMELIFSPIANTVIQLHVSLDKQHTRGLFLLFWVHYWLFSHNHQLSAVCQIMEFFILSCAEAFDVLIMFNLTFFIKNLTNKSILQQDTIQSKKNRFLIISCSNSCIYYTKHFYIFLLMHLSDCEVHGKDV